MDRSILIMQIILLYVLAVACTAYDVFYVLPDNSTNSSCPTRPCITLGKYLLDNSILPATMNVEYRFLPGKHQVTGINKIMLQNLCNFSFVGNDSKPSVAILDSNILFINSSNVTIMNIMFKSDIEHSVITFNTCLSCHIKHVTFINYVLAYTNLIGQSYLYNITVYLTGTPSKCYHMILLQYSDLPWDYYGEYTVIITKLTVNGNDNACHNPDFQYGASISYDKYITLSNKVQP